MNQETHRLESIAAADKRLDARHADRVAPSLIEQALRSHLAIATNPNVDETTVRRSIGFLEQHRDMPDAAAFLKRRDERASLAALKARIVALGVR